ncbi:Carbohydrate-selective porin, OprB family [Lysobacter silvestris]|uniref:Carbohydrate-selective porin, OprB family n=2 Tax=Solilutibacter silvestris TaxID=1645665 RepID=A0A2K1PYP6_9GAMM|nr:Carbohydrate-selective porin, OprB family [Lysobacter silvestris]
MRTPWLLAMLVSTSAMAQQADGTAAQDERFSVHGQATYVWQRKSGFAAAYSGDHSLLATRENSYTFSGTLFLGAKLWQGGELYFNPEIVQGRPISNVSGLGGPTNGEMQKTSGPRLTLYAARGFFRQRFDLGGADQQVVSAANQLATTVKSRRLVVTIGNLAVNDIFDRNDYAGDPRGQFLDWSLLTHAAWDFPADARGYTWGGAVEWYHDAWALRAGRFEQPKWPNQLPLDAQLFRHFGDQVEIEHDHAISGQPGKVLLLGFRGRAVMARYSDALALADASGGAPSLDAVRTREHDKTGVGIDVQQAITGDAGAFVRAMHADGRTETYAFSEVDRSLSAGLSLKGARWGRPDDALGVALAVNALSPPHRDYLARGGLGFFLGDGALDYRNERIIETYYALQVAKSTHLSLDWQHIDNPGYNHARGPVHVLSARLHAEF